jgi:hypothetical protein
MGGDWDELWPLFSDEEKRLIVGGVLAYIEVTVTPGTTHLDWRREITSWAYQPWI